MVKIVVRIAQGPTALQVALVMAADEGAGAGTVRIIVREMSAVQTARVKMCVRQRTNALLAALPRLPTYPYTSTYNARAHTPTQPHVHARAHTRLFFPRLVYFSFVM